jgi:hypothetical protein
MDYEVQTIHGVFIDHGVPVMAQDLYPFADLSDDEMNALYDDLTDQDLPFADLNDDEFLDNFMPPARFFHYPTPVPYYECDDMDDMDWVNY